MDKQPVVVGVAFIAAVDSIFYYMGFKEPQKLIVITFILALVITIYYFDKRIEKLENRMENE